MANPMGSILTGAMMLAHLGMTAEAAKIEAAVVEAVREKKTTVDVGGTMGTRECAQWIAERVGSSCERRANGQEPRAKSSICTRARPPDIKDKL